MDMREFPVYGLAIFMIIIYREYSLFWVFFRVFQAFCRTLEINMVFTKNIKFSVYYIFFLNFRKVLDLVSLTACLDIVIWLVALNELQKVVLFLKNFSYNFQKINNILILL